MFKLIVVCAFFAAAAAKPSALIQAPIATQYSTFIQPATTTIVKEANSVIHPSSLQYYSTPLYSQYIKKLSPEWSVPTYFDAGYKPLAYGQYILPSAAPAIHLIKKRSAPILSAYSWPATYTATSYAATSPLISSATLIPSSPVISHAFPYTHLIKKRSAAINSHFIAPAAYSLQSTHTPFLTYGSTPITYSSTPITYGSTPISYANPFAYSRLY